MAFSAEVPKIAESRAEFRVYLCQRVSRPWHRLGSPLRRRRSAGGCHLLAVAFVHMTVARAALATDFGERAGRRCRCGLTLHR
jgi:hypothetical protein